MWGRGLTGERALRRRQSAQGPGGRAGSGVVDIAARRRASPVKSVQKAPEGNAQPPPLQPLDRTAAADDRRVTFASPVGRSACMMQHDTRAPSRALERGGGMLSGPPPRFV